MTAIDRHRAELRTRTDWIPYLLAESNLPGPRGNLELLAAVLAEGDRALFDACLAFDRPEGTAGTSEEYLVFCGIAGQGVLLAQGVHAAETILRRYTGHPQWRYREAIAIGLQEYGKRTGDALFDLLEDWVGGALFDQRAVIAAACEPSLLITPDRCRRTLRILDRVTAALAAIPIPDRRGEAFRVLRQSLGYCWSVAAVADPAAGLPAMEHWLVNPDRDVRRVMRDNLDKKRLIRCNPEWVERWEKEIGGK